MNWNLAKKTAITVNADLKSQPTYHYIKEENQLAIQIRKTEEKIASRFGAIYEKLFAKESFFQPK